ncbi:MAG: two-component system nitrogen regulation response regulator GlnG [Enterobacterales bacterium]|jgi:two-component system nitrogen regulation response regulator GlnG
MNTSKLLIIDDDDSIRWVLEKAAKREQIATVSVSSNDNILEVIKTEQPDAIISDIRMPGTDGLEMLSNLQESHPELPVIIMTAHSDLDTAVAAFKNGAFEYLPKPFDIKEALTAINRAINQRRKNYKAKQGQQTEKLTGIIGEAPAMQQLFRALGRLSRSEATVLLNGESGTGKELVAKALHSHSTRSEQPFIALNMAAIPKELVESELFGHEKGAFTGANQRRIGRFEQANKGTLFLDEIGDMPLETQTRLLRVLADGEFYRVGGHIPIQVDVRVIAATHQNLQSLVEEGEFREDLYHRINVIRLHLPRLAERSEDIGLLAEHFLIQAADELGVSRKHLRKDALEFLKSLKWPGNVRQLENVCRWLTVMASGNEIHRIDLPEDLQQSSSGEGVSWQDLLRQSVKQEFGEGKADILTHTLPEFEKILLEEALAITNGHKQKAAKKLGWGRNTLTRKLKELYTDHPGANT